MNYISDETKWLSVNNCDKNYDGRFFYGVITTKIFCRPSCKSRTPLQRNTLFFDNYEEAIIAGFRPCKRCRPDLLVKSYEPNKDLLHKVKAAIDLNYNNPIEFKEISQDVGLSEFYLRKLFKEYFKYSPQEYISQKRIIESLKLLIESELDITEIAYKVGFNSICTYYKNFSKLMNSTPKQYRQTSKIKTLK